MSLLDELKEKKKTSLLDELKGIKTQESVSNIKSGQFRQDQTTELRQPETNRETVSIDLQNLQPKTPEEQASVDSFKQRESKFREDKIRDRVDGLGSNVLDRLNRGAEGFKQGVTEVAVGGLQALPFGDKLVPENIQQDVLRNRKIDTTITTPKIFGKEFDIDINPQSIAKATTGLGLTVAQYGTINNILKGVNATSKLGRLLGGSKLARFGATQAVDLLADVIVQTPSEVVNAIKNDDSLDEFAKNTLINRGLDLGINLLIGGVFEAKDAIKAFSKADPKALEQAISDLSPENAKIVRDAIQTNVEVPLSPTLKSFEPAKPKRFGVDDIMNKRTVELYGEKYQLTGLEGNNYKAIDPVGQEVFLPKVIVDEQAPLSAVQAKELNVRQKANELLADSSLTEPGQSFSEGFLKSDLMDSGLQRGEAGDFVPARPRIVKDSVQDLLDKNFASSEQVLRNKLQRIADGTENASDMNLKNYIENSLETTSYKPDDFKVEDFKIGDDTVSLTIPKEETIKSFEDNSKSFYENLNINDEVKTTVSMDSLEDKTFNNFLKRGYSVPEAEAAETLVKNINDIEIKDLGPTERWTTDIYRNVEKVFGPESEVKKIILDPLDQAKSLKIDEENMLLDQLQKDVVENLGIKRKTKESALVQKYGEGNIDEAGLIKEVGQEKATKIIEADRWFRQKYDQLIDDINESRVAMGKDEIPKLDNYYRHFTEMNETFGGIRNVFETNRQISPKLEGLSEFTKPGEKWASFKQKRKGGKFTEDAVSGFLDYTRAATYAKHIDPQITRIRTFQRELTNQLGDNTKINNFVGFLDEFTNDLSGKTNKFDRAIQDLLGRKTFQILNLLNTRMKTNAVLGSVSSSLSQIANVPQGIATVKSPKHVVGGLDGYFKSIFGGGDDAFYKQSGFLKERLQNAYSKFDTRIIDQPKKFAGWMLGALDETGTKFIWSMNYRKALADGVENPIKQADEITRKLVAGRGIGEVPILQKSKTFQMIAPFTLEVSNLWKIQKDFIKNKDFGALAILYGANFLLNDVLEGIRGSRVTFDPLNAALEGLQTEGGLGDKLLSIGGNVGGEILGNLPLGQSVASVYPEYGGDVFGLELPTREKLFGENDPTRFGTDLPIARALQKPISSLVLPFGGQQARKTLEGGQALGLIPTLEDGKLKTEQEALTKSGRLITPTNLDLESISKGLLFGKYAIPEVKAIYDSGATPFGEVQTQKFRDLVETNLYNADELFTAITDAKKFSKKEDRIRELSKQYKGKRLDTILRDFFNYKID